MTIDSITYIDGMRVARMLNAHGPDEEERVEVFLPDNFQTYLAPCGDVWIVGLDNAGWTLENYVIPRLASGLWFAEVMQ